MTEKYKKSLTFHSGVTLKNRVMMAPMTNRMSFHNGDVTQDELDYYALRTGELGAVITAAANVSPSGKGWEGEFSIDSDENLPSLSSLASTIQKNDTKAIIQLFHAGRMTNKKVLRGEQPVSASAIAAERPNAETPRALLDSEIIEMIEDFKAATIRSYQAGFDGIELHGANTYLIQQFFSPHSNRREDKWGGSLEKRYRFIEMLVDAVIDLREEFERPFLIGYRFSPEEYENPGIRMEDTLFLVDKLADKALDYLHISLNQYDRVAQSESYQEKSILQYIHEEIDGRLPLVSVGGIETGKDLENALSNSELAALGRVILTEPHWVKKVFNGREETLRLTIAEEDYEELKIKRAMAPFLKGMMSDRIR